MVRSTFPLNRTRFHIVLSPADISRTQTGGKSSGAMSPQRFLGNEKLIACRMASFCPINYAKCASGVKLNLCAQIGAGYVPGDTRYRNAARYSSWGQWFSIACSLLVIPCCGDRQWRRRFPAATNEMEFHVEFESRAAPGTLCDSGIGACDKQKSQPNKSGSNASANFLFFSLVDPPRRHIFIVVIDFQAKELWFTQCNRSQKIEGGLGWG